jgi:flagellar motor switch protein FliM
VILPTSIARIAAPRRASRVIEDRMGIGRVLPLPVTVIAELRRVQIPLSKLQELRPGYLLDLGPTRDVVVRVGERAALVGEAGVQNAARSVRVKGRVDGDLIR